MGKVVLSDKSSEVATSRYFANGEDWEKCAFRVADTISQPESNRQLFRDKFFEVIYNMDFLPGGRILRNAGRPRGSLFNCYHLYIGDSREEIGQYMKDCLILWGEGGGVGCNYSTLRPKGDPILGVGGNSSGLVSFMVASDAVANTIESGGSRRAASLGSVDVSHPEILDVVDAKLVHGILPHFNISVTVNGDFLEAVEANKDWEFKFKQRSYGKVKAKMIWDKIIENMIKCAEPGLINWDNLKKNNSYYYDPVTGTNPCGEAVLSPYDVCDLGSLVLPNFITGNVNTNWKKMEEVIKLAVRFLDNVIDVNKYSIEQIKIKAFNSRRIGLGVMGLAEYLFAKEAKYGSKKALAEVERLMRFFRDCIYQSLVELAVEKGAFPKFDPVAYGKASFIRKLPASLRMDIKDKGVRNVTSMAIAPTGTISLLAEVTSGIEPLFATSYERSDRVSKRVYVHPTYLDLIVNNKPIPDWFVGSFDLKPEDHFEIQRMVQMYTDGAVSKTINLPAGTTPNQLSRLLLEYINDLKGVTVYVDGSRDGQIYKRMSKNEVLEYVKKNKIEITKTLTEDDVECSLGVCKV